MNAFSLLRPMTHRRGSAKEGQALHLLGEDQEALASYDHALALAPDDADIWAFKGDPLTDLERYHEALVAHEYSLQRAPGDSLVWSAKAAYC
jgi:tetratricopeptide (TPR) repeat protein